MLDQFLAVEIYSFMLVFARLGAMVMILPAFGETSIPARIRLVVALGISLLVFPLVSNAIPALPTAPLALGILLLNEILIGAFIAGSARLMISGLHVAGTIIAFQTGLAVAQGFDPAQGNQSALLGTFMTLLGVVLIFASNLHLVMIMAMHDSYTLFPAGQFINTADFARGATDAVAGAFALGVHIAAPFLVYGLLFYGGLGLLNRLMPQMQVFFVVMPLNILLGFVIFMLVISAAMMWFLEYFERGLAVFLV